MNRRLVANIMVLAIILSSSLAAPGYCANRTPSYPVAPQRGNLNADGRVDIADLILIYQYLFSGETVSVNAEAADANGDGRVDIADPIYLGQYLFGTSYLPTPQEPTPDFIRGDLNNDGIVDIADLVVQCDYFAGLYVPEVLDSADFNDDGRIDIADRTAMLHFMSGRGAAPKPPYPGAGKDPTPDNLGWVPDEHPEQFIRGDADRDTDADMADVLSILNYLFSGGKAPEPLDAADANDDGAVNIADPIYLANYINGRGSAPLNPYPAAGLDPTADGLVNGQGNATGANYFIRGDADNNKKVTSADVTFIIRYLFSSGKAPDILDAADVNDNGAIDLGDATRLAAFLRARGVAPAAPYPNPGPDPTGDNL